MLTRDSWILGLTIAGAVLTVIVAQFNALPAAWQEYQGLVTIIAACVAAVAGILRTSPLAGASTPTSESRPALGGLVKLSDKGDALKLPTWLVAALLVPAIALTPGCGPTTKPTLVKVDSAIYQSVKALHDTAVVLGDSKVITPAQELKIQEAILPVSILGEQATKVLLAWKSGPTPPELQALVREMGLLTQKIIAIVPQNADAKAALLEKVALIQQAIASVLLILGGVA